VQGLQRCYCAFGLQPVRIAQTIVHMFFRAATTVWVAMTPEPAEMVVAAAKAAPASVARP
jgi:hypothetical protein